MSRDQRPDADHVAERGDREDGAGERDRFSVTNLVEVESEVREQKERERERPPA